MHAAEIDNTTHTLPKMQSHNLRIDFSSLSMSVLCFSLLVLPILTKSLPPSLPAEVWEGKTSVDYYEVHNKYTEVLVCIWIPLGTLGFVFWFSSFLVTLLNLTKASGLYLELHGRSSDLTGGSEQAARMAKRKGFFKGLASKVSVGATYWIFGKVDWLYTVS